MVAMEMSATVNGKLKTKSDMTAFIHMWTQHKLQQDVLGPMDLYQLALSDHLKKQNLSGKKKNLF